MSNLTNVSAVQLFTTPARLENITDHTGIKKSFLVTRSDKLKRTQPLQTSQHTQSIKKVNISMYPIHNTPVGGAGSEASNR